MNHAQLNEIVKNILGRPCSCEEDRSVKPCPQRWHTWRRFNKNGDLAVSLATCFVGNDNDSLYSQSFNVNMSSTKEAEKWRISGRKLGLNCLIDQGDGSQKRVWVNTSDINELSAPQMQFIESLLKNAIGAFKVLPDNR